MFTSGPVVFHKIPAFVDGKHCRRLSVLIHYISILVNGDLDLAPHLLRCNDGGS